MTSPQDEKELLLQLREGSEQAFEKIYKKYNARLYSNLVRLIKLESEAQEILQDVFVKIWDHRQHIDIERSFRSYLFKIAENKVYDFFRKAARDKKREAQIIALTTAETIGIDELLNADKSAFLEKAIASLPPQRQQVFRLCKLDGKSYDEVSKLLGISVSTISDHIVKATKAIRFYFANNPQVMLLLSVFSYPTSS